MLSRNLSCFVSVPNPENRRVLVPGKVLELNGQAVAVEFDEALALAPGAEVLLFAEFRQKFHQQGATVVTLREGSAKPTVEFNLVGEPVNCEGRETYRVSAVAYTIPVTVGKSIGQLADVSVDGLAVISPTPLQVGQTVQVKFVFDVFHFEGTLRVQTEKKLPSGKVRYGLFAAERKGPARRSLEAISAQLQRLQLRRLSRAA